MSAPIYKVIENRDAGGLAVEVDKFLESDWELVGGVSHTLTVDIDRDGCKEYIETWAQAVIKK